jgi:hypothetical protein
MILPQNYATEWTEAKTRRLDERKEVRDQMALFADNVELEDGV